MARVVLNPFGSFGDLHPYLALALELQRRGHSAVIATSDVYRDKVKAEGIAFAPVRPDVGKFLESPELLAHLWDSKRGTEYLLREFLIPQVGAAYEDLLPACSGADLLVTHMAGLAGPLVAEKLRLRWLSVALQPSAFFSTCDPMVLAAAPWLRHLYRAGRWVPRLLMSIADRETNRWAEPLHALRRELGLPVGRNPIMAGQFSPFGTLALFSRHFAAPQVDWPARVSQPGFLFYDDAGRTEHLVETGEEAHRNLKAFLASGEAPVLFTLGSSAVLQAGDFFSESWSAARMLGCRAILLAGPRAHSLPPSPEVLVAPYLRFSEVMPHVAAIVHQGGIGTLAQALRAGRPSVVVPWSHDQPDNAYRLERLGVARVLNRNRYRADRVARLLEQVLRDEGTRNRAESLGSAIRQESALEIAADAVEGVL